MTVPITNQIMKTKNICFGSDNELMIWQEKNCLRCKKAVWYNQRLHRMPQYRCAIQKQVEAQVAGEIEINDRTYKATRTKTCPMLKGKDEEHLKPKVLVFSKGESMVEKAVTKPQKIETPKKIVEADENNDVELVKLSRETGMDFNVLKDAERKMYEILKSGEAVPPVFREIEFKQEVKSNVKKMLQTFTWKENMMIAFAPLVISQLAWIYTEEVLNYCKEHRIYETLKLGRAVKHIHEEYNNTLRKDLDSRHIERIDNQTRLFHEHYLNDFVILRCCVDAAFLKQYPNVKHREMRVAAYIVMLMCRFLVLHNNRMDKVITAKMGFSQSVKDPNIDKLETCMDAYCGDFVIENTPNIDACMRILQKNINEIDFEIDDSEAK